MNIDEYISITRTVSDLPTNVDYFYNQWYQRIVQQFYSSGDLPSLRVVYTLQRACEIVEIPGRIYLIYDHYLGQTMNMLNRILLYSDDVRDSAMVLYKLIAENYACSGGKLHLAMVFALAYTELQSESTLFLAKEDLLRWSLFTHSQELFVIAHELSHFILRNPQNHNKEYRLKSSSLLSAEADNEAIGKFFEEIAERFQFNGIHYYGPRLFKAGALFSSGIREECLCDILATLIVGSFFKSQLEFNLTDVYVAIAMGLRHLRFLGGVHDICSNLTEIQPIHRNYLELEYSIRTLNIREFLHNNLLSLGVTDENSLSNIMFENADKYERQIDITLLSVRPKIDEIIQLDLQQNSQNIFDDEITLTDIGMVTGFFETIEKSNYSTSSKEASSFIDKRFCFFYIVVFLAFSLCLVIVLPNLIRR